MVDLDASEDYIDIAKGRLSEICALVSGDAPVTEDEVVSVVKKVIRDFAYTADERDKCFRAEEQAEAEVERLTRRWEALRTWVGNDALMKSYDVRPWLETIEKMRELEGHNV